MSEAMRCKHCGARIYAGDLQPGLCPRCLLGPLRVGSGLASESSTRATSAVSDRHERRERIGQYEILERLGEGGMGEVYLARQSAPLRRTTAVKVIKPGMDTRQVVARFESERQVLAMMDHPGIAKVFDAGTTERGRPFFVMEYVDGLPITTYCERNRSSLGQRLELFIQVCEAVQHAHQKGIIHRDLKPTNVLVEDRAGQAVPKVIDFGVSKALGHGLSEHSLMTELGELVGTPEYMSPEQASGTGLDVDTRTDVYSLGVLLYELLVGVLPISREGLGKAAADELLRRIRDEEPLKPSARASSEGARAESSAMGRSSQPRSQWRQLRGDLDWITMKALAKELPRRYASVSELAADVRRHLSFEPVSAGPPSAAYRLRKLVQRNRRVFAGAALVLAALLASLTGISVALVRARTAERVASNEARKAHRVAEFLIEVFSTANPFGEPRANESLGEYVTARQILDAGARRAETELEDQPILRAELEATIGSVYGELGMLERADSLLQDALAIREAELGDAHVGTARTWAALARISNLRGESEQARSYAEMAVPVLERELGPDHIEVAEALAEIWKGYIARHRLAEAEPLILRALDIAKGRLGPESPQTAQYMIALAHLRTYQKRIDEAVELADGALAIYERAYGPDHPRLVPALERLADIYSAQGRLPEARRLNDRALAITEAVAGPDHPRTLAARRNVAFDMHRNGEPGKAEALLLEILEAQQRVLGAEHPDIALTMYGLSNVFAATGRLEKAEEFARRTIEIQQQAGFVHYLSWYTLASILDDLDRTEEAEALYERSIQACEEQLGPDYPLISWVIDDLAQLRLKQGRLDEAEELSLRANRITAASFGPDSPDLAFGLHTIARIHRAQERYAEAERELRKALSIRLNALGANHFLVERSLESLTSLLEQLGRDPAGDEQIAELISQREAKRESGR